MCLRACVCVYVSVRMCMCVYSYYLSCIQCTGLVLVSKELCGMCLRACVCVYVFTGLVLVSEELLHWLLVIARAATHHPSSCRVPERLHFIVREHILCHPSSLLVLRARA